MNTKKLEQWISKYDEIYLFGMGDYGKAVEQYLNKRGVDIKGFIVSETWYVNTGNQHILEIKCFKQFYYDNPQNVGLILTLDSKHYNDILKELSFAINDIYFMDESLKTYCLTLYKQSQQLKNLDYSTEFYLENLQYQKKNTVALVKSITNFIKPKSVVDVGCGVGLITKTFLQFGAEQVLGIDGDYIDRSSLQIDPRFFVPHDLTKPFESDRRYDLAISLEVAEHLDIEYAEQFVRTLCGLSDVIVFSAAIPGQGGVQHINEQPQSYWANLFAKYDYKAIDCLRPLIWNNPVISDWYKQNIIFYLKIGSSGNENLKNYIQEPLLDVIHPQLFARIIQTLKIDTNSDDLFIPSSKGGPE